MFFSSPKKPPATREQFSNPLFSIGKHTYGKPDIRTYGDNTRLTIGRFCSISSKVTIILGGNHRIDWVTTYPFPALSSEWPEARAISGHPESKGDLTIGHDVWIGHGATILSGLTIGSGAVIGACSVVNQDIPPYGIVAGNPARLLRTRFDQETCNALLEMSWWNWPEDTIKKHMELLCSNRIHELLKVT